MLICDPRFGLSQISWRRHHPTEDTGWPRLATACQPTETGTPGPASGQGKRRAVQAAGLLGAATLAGVLLTSVLQGQLKYALPLSGGVTVYVAATDLLPEVNREPGWRMPLLVFVGVASMLILRGLIKL